MANHTGPNAADGVLNKATLKQFFGYTGPEDALVFNPGTERIPENWYRRIDSYTIEAFGGDILYFAQKEPRSVSVGGNMGKVNSFTSVSLGDLTGGVLNAADLLQGNNAICFVMQFALAAAPDSLQPLLGPAGIAKGIDLLQGVTGPLLSKASCPQISKFDMPQLNQFPGYSKLSTTGRY